MNGFFPFPFEDMDTGGQTLSVVLEAKGRVPAALGDDFLEPAISREKLARRYTAASTHRSSKFLLYLKGQI